MMPAFVCVHILNGEPIWTLERDHGWDGMPEHVVAACEACAKRPENEVNADDWKLVHGGHLALEAMAMLGVMP